MPVWTTSWREKVDALKRAVDLRDLFLERYPGRFRRSGRWLYGSSPYRRDEHPSFAVNEDVYIDFATGEHGDELDFLMREQGMTFREAVEALEARAGIVEVSRPPGHAQPRPSPRRADPPSAAWQEVMRAECQRAQAYLFSNRRDARRALRWLMARGLKRTTIRRAGLGFNPAWRQTRLVERESERRVLIAPGVVIPCTVGGALGAVHIRTLPDVVRTAEDLPKYLYVRGSKTGGMYNGDALVEGCTVLMVEGEFDALLAQQELGEQAVVVTLGSAANRLPQQWLARLQAARRVYSCFDNDEAGARAAANLATQLGEKHRALALKQGKDITDYVVQYKGDLLDWWRDETSQDVPPPVQLPLL
ncbi:MAG: toprim domain-containing protein [Chloroflexi bacterium]|nr:toprim domain-containing protein [Chloroflexota bacterium]